MSIITRFLKFSIPFCLISNIPLATKNKTAFAKPACFSNNIYQKKSLKCQSKNTHNKGRLFSIYSTPSTTQKEKTRPTVKAFRQWNKNFSPANFNSKPKLDVKLNINTNKQNQPISLTPDRYPNFTLTSNGADQHAITILSSVKVALASPENKSTQPPSPSLAALHLRCIQNTTSVMFEFPTTKLANAKASTEILYSIDNGPDRLLGLSRSKGDNILGLWTGKKAVPFTTKLLGKSSLRINVWDAGRIEYAFEFDVTNLGNAIYNLRNACNW